MTFNLPIAAFEVYLVCLQRVVGRARRFLVRGEKSKPTFDRNASYISATININNCVSWPLQKFTYSKRPHRWRPFIVLPYASRYFWSLMLLTLSKNAYAEDSPFVGETETDVTDDAKGLVGLTRKPRKRNVRILPFSGSFVDVIAPRMTKLLVYSKMSHFALNLSCAHMLTTKRIVPVRM